MEIAALYLQSITRLADKAISLMLYHSNIYIYGHTKTAIMFIF